MMVVAQFIQPVALTAGIYFLLQRFHSIGGWTVYEIFLCHAIIGICFSVATCFARGFDGFAKMIRTASFDRILVRPRSTILQVLGSSFDIKRVGIFINAIIILIPAIMKVDISWNISKVILLINMVIGGSLIFSGVYMLNATAAFWTTEALEITNIFTHGIKEHASYPLDIYPKWITVFFTFIIPFGTINYIPLQFLLGKIAGSTLLYTLIPLAGSLFIIPCTMLWRFGVRKYSSTGS